MAFEDGLPMRVTRKHKDGVTLRLDITAELLNGNGTVHGGAIAAIADEAAWHALIHHFGGKRSMTTTELKVNYLLPLREGRITVRAYLVRAGKTLCVSRVDLMDARKRVAALAVVTYMLLDGSP